MGAQQRLVVTVATSKPLVARNGSIRMKVVIGVVPGESSDDALALGGLLCDALGAEPILAHIHPAAYDYASPGHVDAEWEKYLVDRCV